MHRIDLLPWIHNRSEISSLHNMTLNPESFSQWGVNMHKQSNLTVCQRVELESGNHVCSVVCIFYPCGNFLWQPVEWGRAEIPSPATLSSSSSNTLGIPWPDVVCCPYSMFWVYPGASYGRHPRSILIRCPNHLDWLLSTQRSNDSNPCSWMSEHLTLPTYISVNVILQLPCSNFSPFSRWFQFESLNSTKFYMFFCLSNVVRLVNLRAIDVLIEIIHLIA